MMTHSWLIWRDRYFAQCKNCRWPHGNWNGEIYVVHPISGWWEQARLHGILATLLCGCSFYDARGTLLRDSGASSRGTSFFTICDLPAFRNRHLCIDYVANRGFVKFYDLWDSSFSDDVVPFDISICDIIAHRSLRPLAEVVRILRKQVLDLRELRKASNLARYMRWMDLHKFRCCSRVVWQGTAPFQYDSVWAAIMHAAMVSCRNDFYSG